jgi:excisionase family DNA binding protein
MTSAEACEQLEIDRSTLSRWVASGTITPAQKLPGLRGAFLFTPGDVEKLRSAMAPTPVPQGRRSA